MTFLHVLGIFGTIVWGFIVAVTLRDEWNAAQQMALNEWGDFLAGLFTPIAFLWLVLGYFLQSKELRLNTKALELQQQELARQVEETKNLVESTTRQAYAFERVAALSESEQEREAQIQRMEAQPIFANGRITSGGREIKTIIENRGKVAIEATLDSASNSLKLTFPERWEPGNSAILIHDTRGGNVYPIQFVIRYKDRFGDKHAKLFLYSNDGRIKEAEEPDKRPLG